MSNRFETPLRIVLTYSSIQRYIERLLYGLALMACLVNGLPLEYRLLLTLVVAGIWFLGPDKQSRKTGHLYHLPHQGWSLSLDGEHYDSIEVLPSTVVMDFLMILHYAFPVQASPRHTGDLSVFFRQSLASAGRQHRMKTWVIFRSDLLVDDYRRLAVRLKLSFRANKH